MKLRQLTAYCAALLGTVTIASAYTHPVYFYNYTDQPITIRGNIPDRAPDGRSNHRVSLHDYNEIAIAPFSRESNAIYSQYGDDSYTTFNIIDSASRQKINSVDITSYQDSHISYRYDMEFEDNNSDYNPLAYINGQRAASDGWSAGQIETGSENQDFLIFILPTSTSGHYNWPNCPSVTGLNNPEDEQFNQLDTAGRWNSNYACYFKGDAKGDQPQYKADYIGADPATETFNSSGNLDPTSATNALYRITFLGGSYWMGPYANTDFTYSIDKDSHHVYPNNGYTSYRWAGNAPLTKQLEPNMAGITYNMGDSDGFAKIFYTPNTFSWVISIPKSEDHIDIGLHNHNFDADTYLSSFFSKNYDSNTMVQDQQVKTHIILPKPPTNDKGNDSSPIIKTIAFDNTIHKSYGNGIEATTIGIKLKDINNKLIDPSSDAYKHIVFYYHDDDDKPTGLVDNDLVSNRDGDANLAIITDSDMSHRLSYFYSNDAKDPIEQISTKLNQHLKLPLYYDPTAVSLTSNYKKFYLYSYNPVNPSQPSVGKLTACYIDGNSAPICTHGDNNDGEATINVDYRTFSEQATTNTFKCDHYYDCSGIGVGGSASNMSIPNTPSYAFHGGMMSAIIDTQYNPDASSVSQLFIDGVNYNPNIFVHHDLPLFINVVSGETEVYKDQLLSENYDKEHSSSASYNRTVAQYDEPVVSEGNTKEVKLGYIADVYGYNNRFTISQQFSE